MGIKQAGKQKRASKPAPAEGLRLEFLSIASLKGADKNPKQHSADIGRSISRFGYVEPIVIDERTKRLVAGHGRREALLALQRTGEPPPPGIREEGTDWLVPVLRGWRSKSKAEADAYLLASNQLTAAGGWDDAGLAALLKSVSAEGASLEGLGFDDATLLKALSMESQTPVAPPKEASGKKAVQKSFTLTDEQAETVDRALIRAASFIDGADDGGASALAHICASFLGEA